MPERKEGSSGGSGCGSVGCLTFLGAPPAMWCSWMLNQSLLWAGFHGFFWWAYLPYLCLGCGGGLPEETPW